MELQHGRKQTVFNLLLLAIATSALILSIWPHAFDTTASEALSPDPASGVFETLTVERINIVDPDGTLRLAIANRAHPPDVIYRGETYPKRSIDDLAGIVFYESDGDELGGVAAAKLRDMRQSAFILDYTHQLTDGVGIVKRESEDGERWEAGFFISDRRPYEPGKVTSSQGVERIWLSNRNKDASLVISDPDGRPRIRIGVNETGEPSIQMLDENGSPVFDARQDAN